MAENLRLCHFLFQEASANSTPNDSVKSWNGMTIRTADPVIGVLD